MTAPATPALRNASSTGTPELRSSSGAFTDEQKEYLAGWLAGVAHRPVQPYVGEVPGTRQLTSEPALGGPNLSAPAEETIHGTPISEVTKQELWKRELHGLDAWDRLLEHADAGKFPDEADTFRFRYHGLFYVAPAQNSFMLRCRIPAGELTAAQLSGLAQMADDFGDGKAAITTRSNLQIRGIAPQNLVQVVVRLQSLGLTARGSGVDNVRNITASPTAGFDPQELIDTRPFAHALHHYILNHRDLFDLPRKFNVAFEGGGSIDTVADTNDIGFMAVQLTTPCQGVSLKDGSTVPLPSGVYFRVELCGISGHRQLASDAGILIKPAESVAVAAAMIRVFGQHGDRTDRKKARLKYLVDRWGVERFLQETQQRLAFPVAKFPREQCQERQSAIRHGHVGAFRQKQAGRNYLGVVVPVGMLTSRQMRRLAELAANYATGQIRLTPWQNLLIPDIPDGFLETVKRQVVRAGLHHSATAITGGLVACTGNKGCKWAATDTKGHAVALGRTLDKAVSLDQPINIHLTGCPNSCAQHYVGDIGLQGVKVSAGGDSVEGYHVVLGGGTGPFPQVGRQIFTGIPFEQIQPLLERALQVYLARRQPGESFAAFTRRHDVAQLQEMFS
ncbi:MAG: NirA family protein [Verrucomicrobiales bacterium]|nr:NirA family protein [Verrucomicrobiales bacterium]